MPKAKFSAMLMALALMLVYPLVCAAADEAPRLDKDTLKAWLSDPQVLVLDVRQPQDWQASAKKIKGAVREDPNDVKSWAAALPRDKKIVLYCA